MAYLLVNMDLFGSQLGSPKEISEYVSKLAASKLYNNASTLVEHVRAHTNALSELNKEDMQGAISVIVDTDEFLNKLSKLVSLEPYIIIKLDMPAIPQPTAARTTSPC